MTDSLMVGAPPRPQDQVTLGNWRQPPFNRWAFQHLREVVPTAAVLHDPDAVWGLTGEDTDLRDLPFPAEGRDWTLDGAMAELDSDALVVLHRGRIVLELTYGAMTPRRQHIIFSVTKSVVGALTGILVEQGVIDPAATVAKVIPELAASAYGDATLRHLLDMTAGVVFEEDYLATSGVYADYRLATGWNPRPDGAETLGLWSFLPRLDERTGPHGEVFSYLSPNSDLIGWMLERTSGRRVADLLSELLWQPLGAEAEASLGVDPFGAARTAGGLAVTPRDLARVGQLMLQQGARDGRQIVPAAWIADIRSGGDPAAWQAGTMAESFPGRPIRYRSQWYIMGEGEVPYFGLGIHGQHLYVDPRAELVVAHMSAQPEPINDVKDRIALRAFEALAAALSGGGS